MPEPMPLPRNTGSNTRDTFLATASNVSGRGGMLAPDAPDPSKYHTTSWGGRRGVVVPAVDPKGMGRSQGFDVNDVLAKTPVIDYEEESQDVLGADGSVVETMYNTKTAVHNPGDSDHPFAKAQETKPCTNTESQPQKPQEASTSDQLLSAVASLKSATPESTSATSTPAVDSTQKRGKPGRLDPRVDALSQQISGLTSAVELLLKQQLSTAKTAQASPQPCPQPQPVTPSPATPSTPAASSAPPKPALMVSLESGLGKMKCEAEGADFDEDTQTLVLVFDPDKPHAVPAASDTPLAVAVAGSKTYYVKSYGMSLNVRFGGKKYVIVPLPLAEDTAA